MEKSRTQAFQQFWAIAKPYWFSSEKRGAWGLLLSSGLLLVAYTGLSVALNTQRGDLISALSAKDVDRFWRIVLIFLAIVIVYVPLFAGNSYLRNKLALYWRKWLTNSILGKYFSDRAYYDITTNSDIDNPDQRIAEDIKSFTQQSLKFSLILISSILQIIAFSGVLWGISKPLVIFLVVYALAGTGVTTAIFGRILVRLNFEQLKREANFRFGLVRIRENAESIAFYRGETQESGKVKDLFIDAFDNFNRLIFWEFNLNLFSNGYEFITFVLPAIIVAPGVFSGEFEVGKVTEAQGAFFRIFFSLNVIVNQFQDLTSFGAGINRLYTFTTALESPDLRQHFEAQPELNEQPNYTNPQGEPPETETSQRPQLQRTEKAYLALAGVTLYTPNHQRTLVQDLSFALESEQGLLIVGPSGCGKSSLLRAIAGLWNAGNGTIVRPNLEAMLFLPQRPYMILGTLRNQLLYPNAAEDITAKDEDLQRILQQVNLPDLADRFGGFDVEQDWADLLSLGEQQRIAFARLLITKPKYAVLDEATNALDIANEDSLYSHLKAKSTTFVSVGHRPTLLQYHQLVLELAKDGAWQLIPASEYSFSG
ncbi:MAG: ABC transporter ATP-binding protein/permease [Cyanothece sp. SIO1E1]|nr:ABC transporter ATP-binding protein/permease [Cyanothece sp. SIO1E1]